MTTQNIDSAATGADLSDAAPDPAPEVPPSAPSAAQGDTAHSADGTDAEVLALSAAYQPSADDREIVALAADTFASDWRYLEDMCRTATRYDRMEQRAEERRAQQDTDEGA